MSILGTESERVHMQDCVSVARIKDVSHACLSILILQLGQPCNTKQAERVYISEQYRQTSATICTDS